jgi:thiol-disulfide isomerase/thioredoxin
MRVAVYWTGRKELLEITGRTMKKTILILAIAIALALGLYVANKATQVRTSAAGRPTVPKAGGPAPDITVNDLNDKSVTLADYKGKVVLVNFWATWCGPCREEIPSLIEMQEKYGPRGFTVLGIAMDDDGKPVVAPFVEKERYEVKGQKLPMNYPIVIGNENVAEKFGGLLGYPTSVLVSRDGRLIKRVTGPLDDEEISKLIEGAL